MPNRFTALAGCRYPIVQGPMGGGHSTPALVAAVSDAGGFGSLGVYQLAPPEIEAQIADVRRRTERPFGVNLWVPLATDTASEANTADLRAALALVQPYRDELALPSLAEAPAARPQDFDAQVEAVLRAGPPAVSFTFGVPPDGFVREARRRGIVTIGTATTVDEAEAVAASSADAVCASGFEAGGHRGSFLRASEQSLMGTLALVPQVRDAVDLPVIAAGGIADGRGVAAVLALGADAAQLGTAFLVCDESGAGALHRAALADRRRARITTLTRAFSGRLARVLENRFTRDLAAHQGELAPWPVQGALTRELRAASEAAGRDELSGLFAGQSAALASARPAAALVEALVRDAEAVLRRTTL